eukprot:TRINITY_DN2527_c0_g1_i1.p1 TRINITY_DN2527_c0_g1~~TRINITY_DN2527_c0_g1_i1.p1  ORF type:complete len:365 (-),score=85.10 TRINITY_DN2527_c0_g1_i1:403-1497(-)
MGLVRGRPAAITVACACLVAVPSTEAFASVHHQRALATTSASSRHAAHLPYSILRQQRQRYAVTIMSCVSPDSVAATIPPSGTLTLVGAGPGDPDLLTVKAVRVLATADLVIADRLVSKEILDLVEGDLRVARKHPGCAEEAQQEIYRWVKEGVDAGKNVVRLKIGDPFVFGRGGEEILEARKWGLECSVVPGISSVFGAPLLAGIPVTHRGVANQVVLGTGYAKDYGTPDISDYHPEQTAVFLMAVGRLKELCADLMRRGYPATTPVAIVESASTPTQRTVAATVETITAVAAEHSVRAPATIIVGDVVRVLHGDAQGLIQDVALRHDDRVAVTVGDGLPGTAAAAAAPVAAAAAPVLQRVRK